MKEEQTEEKAAKPALTKKKAAFAVFRQYAVITLGCLLYSLGISLFIKPAELSSGGMTGISIIFNHLVPAVDQGIWLIIFNVPMIILGFIFFGWKFIVSTGYATVASALLMFLWNSVFGATGLDILPFTKLQEIDHVSSMLINTSCGGVLFGIGMGLIFRMGASTAGTDILVKILRKKFRHIKTGMISMCSDMIIVLCSLFVTNYNLEKLFYTALSVIVFTLVFDLVLYGGNTAKTVFVITARDKYEKIAERVLKEVDTGATLLDAKGAYTREDKVMMMCVVKSFLYPHLRDVVREEDKNAFMIVSSAKEIYGTHYKNQDDAEL